LLSLLMLLMFCGDSCCLLTILLRLVLLPALALAAVQPLRLLLLLAQSFNGL